jgi:hypothetical protein
MTADKRRRARDWFDLGARALAAAQPGLPAGYGCPLCRRLFSTPEGLTVEHVPPKSVGGRPLVLTCEGCNSKDGHELAHHIQAEAELTEIRTGRRSIRGRYTQYGETLGADVTLGPQPGIRVHERNDPRALKTAREQLERDVARKAVPPEIRLHFRLSYDAWKAQVSLAPRRLLVRLRRPRLSLRDAGSSAALS